MDDTKYMVWLAHLEGAGAYAVDYLLKKFKTAEGIYSASVSALHQDKKVGSALAAKIIELRQRVNADTAFSDMLSKGIGFISKFDEKYPPLLKTIHSPPLGLFIIGKFPDFDKPWVSVIGTRRPTSYGKAVAYNLSKELAEKGVVIVSGMADGLDAIAHKAALDSGGDTVAVLGCGCDICYPAINEGIYEQLKTAGCIVSEFPPGAKPDKWHFPKRNRIISGLSQGLVVVEADVVSGTSITVDHALTQGREVMAVPGNITNNKSAGPNNLIREGAHVATNAKDVLDAIGILETEAWHNLDEEIHNNNRLPLAPDEEKVYSLLDDEPRELDDIIKKAAMEPRAVMVSLMRLKLLSLIEELAGQKYIRTRARA